MDRNTLKSYFLTGKKPTQGQFHALIDSYFHKNEGIDISKITNLSVLLANKVERVDIPHLIDGKQDKTCDMLQTADKTVVGAINELEAQKVNTYQERMIVIPPSFQGYAKILSVKSGSFVFDFEINEYPKHYGYEDISRISRKINDRIMIGTGSSGNNACTLRTKDFVYNHNLYTDQDSEYTDIYLKADDNLYKVISLRLSFATNQAEDAIVYHESPVYTSLECMSGAPAIVDTIQNFRNALRVHVNQWNITAGYQELSNLVDYVDVVIDSNLKLPEGFYFKAMDVGGRWYYQEKAIYRFLFNTEVENFTVKAGAETLFVYPGRILRKEILTAVPPAWQGGEWIFSISNLPPTDSGDTTGKVSDIYSPDESIIVKRDEDTVSLTVNPEIIPSKCAGMTQEQIQQLNTALTTANEAMAAANSKVNLSAQNTASIDIQPEPGKWAEIARLGAGGRVDMIMGGRRVLDTDVLTININWMGHLTVTRESTQHNFRYHPFTHKLYVECGNGQPGPDSSRWFSFRQSFSLSGGAIEVYQEPGIVDFSEIEDTVVLEPPVSPVIPAEPAINHAGHITADVSGTSITGIWTTVSGQITYRGFNLSGASIAEIADETSPHLLGNGSLITMGTDGSYRLRENNKAGQVNMWEIHVDYAALGANASFVLWGKLKCPETGQELLDQHAILTLNSVITNKVIFRFTSISKQQSIAPNSGWQFEIGHSSNSWPSTSTLAITKIRRMSLAI
jgi:hypothetical protein